MAASSNYYYALLKLRGEARNGAHAKKLNCNIIKTLIDPETFLSNNIMNTYSKLGNMEYARRVFDQMPHPNPFSWNTLFSAYSKWGHLSEMQLLSD
jgi:pentatricopeptide repeat protein